MPLSWSVTLLVQRWSFTSAKWTERRSHPYGKIQSHRHVLGDLCFSARGTSTPRSWESPRWDGFSSREEARTRCPFWLGSPSLFSLEVFCVTHPGSLRDVIHGLNKPQNSSVPWLSGCVWLLVVAALKQMSLKASSAALMDCTLHRAAGLGAVLPWH